MSPSTNVLVSATVLMPFDGSPQSVSTFSVARTIARVTEGSLHLVLSGGKSGARERLSLLADGGSEATLHELTGDLAPGLARLATVNPNALIVLPAHGPSRPESGLGAFPEEILRRVDCPVLLVHPGAVGENWKLSQILVPQDGTADAARALCPVTQLAEQSGAEMLVVHVTSDGPSKEPEPGAMEFPGYVDQPQHELPSWVTGFLQRVRDLCKVPPHAAVRFHWAYGDPGREILALARRKRVDLVTVSWSRCLEPGRAKVVQEILRGAPCPILILPCD